MASILDDSYILVELHGKYPPLTPTPYVADTSRFQELKAKLATTSSITVLNELFQRLHLARPKYTFRNSKDGLYLCAVEVDDRIFRSTIPRYWKDESKKDAAEVALNAFWKHPDIFLRKEPTYANGTDVVVTPDKSHITLLKELCRANGWVGPIYQFEGLRSEASFRCIVLIDMGEGRGHFFEGETTYRKKREAKENAAKTVFENLML